MGALGELMHDGKGREADGKEGMNRRTTAVYIGDGWEVGWCDRQGYWGDRLRRVILR